MNEAYAAILTKIRTRGFWEVGIRPEPYAAARIPRINDLRPYVARAEVALRGWNFPQLRIEDPLHIDTNWIGQASEWGEFLELWRFYQSGQFVHISGLHNDWQDQAAFSDGAPPNWAPGAGIPVGQTIYRYTEIFQFASRLASSDAYAGAKKISISILLSGLEKRRIYSDDPGRRLFGPYIASLPEYMQSWSLSREELIAQANNLALAASTELFRRFNWEPAQPPLQEIQERLLSRRF